MPKTVILTPTYNERENIYYLVERVFTLHPELHILVIDDNSPDGTADAVRQLMQRYPNLSLFSRERKEGLGEAYKAGMLKVLDDPDVEAIVTMDADGSHDPEELAALLAQGKNHDLVIGSRYASGGGVENWEPWRYWLSNLGNIYARTITRLPARDMTAGFMHLRASKLRQVPFALLHASGYAFLMELKWTLIKTLQASMTEVPITFKARREGESKISRHIILEGLATPWRVRVGR